MNNKNRYSRNKNGPKNYFKKPKQGNSTNQNKSKGSDLPDLQKKLKNTNKHHRYYSSQIRRGNRKKCVEKNPAEKLFTRYEYLLDQYLKIRRKYFENFYTRDKRLKSKLEATYIHTLKQFNDFTNSLTEDQSKELDQRGNIQELDTSYSDNHNLNNFGEKSPADYHIIDPHILDSQKSTDFSSDTEESVGKIEDYIKS